MLLAFRIHYDGSLTLAQTIVTGLPIPFEGIAPQLKLTERRCGGSRRRAVTACRRQAARRAEAASPGRFFLPDARAWAKTVRDVAKPAIDWRAPRLLSCPAEKNAVMLEDETRERQRCSISWAMTRIERRGLRSASSVEQRLKELRPARAPG